MKIMSKLTIKNLFRNKKNFILCFISVLLSCILLFSVGLAVSTFRQNQINNLIDNYGDYHAIIYNTNINEKNKLNDERVLKRHRIVYKKESVKFEIDEYATPKMKVVAIEGDKDQVDRVYEELEKIIIKNKLD